MHQELDQVIERLQAQIVAMQQLDINEMEALCAKLMEIKIKVRDIEVTLRRYDDMLEMSSCQRY